MKKNLYFLGCCFHLSILQHRALPGRLNLRYDLNTQYFINPINTKIFISSSKGNISAFSNILEALTLEESH